MIAVIAAILRQFTCVLQATSHHLTGVACRTAVSAGAPLYQNGNMSRRQATGTFKRQVFLQMIEMHLKDGKKGDIIALALKFQFRQRVFGVKTCDRLLKGGRRIPEIWPPGSLSF